MRRSSELDCSSRVSWAKRETAGSRSLSGDRAWTGVRAMLRQSLLESGVKVGGGDPSRKNSHLLQLQAPAEGPMPTPNILGLSAY